MKKWYVEYWIEDINDFYCTTIYAESVEEVIDIIKLEGGTVYSAEQIY